MSKLETVIIEHPSNPACSLRINKKNFNPATMKLYLPEVQMALDSIIEPVVLEPTIIEPRLTDWVKLFEEQGWRAVKDAAETLGFEKPDELSWSDALTSIADYEAGLNTDELA